MSNPFYPPTRPQPDTESRGSIGTSRHSDDVVPFDPDRRAGSIPRIQRGGAGETMAESDHNGQDMGEYRLGRHPERFPTDGPGGARRFYPSEDEPSQPPHPHPQYDVVGTGTDGFGAGTPMEHSSSKAPPAYADDVYGHDYRHTYSQRQPLSSQYQSQRSTYEAPFYLNHSPQATVMYLDDIEGQYGGRTLQNGVGHGYVDQQQRQDPPPFRYPPPPTTFSAGTHNWGQGMAADVPGVYRDRAPDMDKLTDEQKEIAETFPADLDREGGSLYLTCKELVMNWRAWVKWRFLHYYIITALLIALVALMTIYHHQIIDWLTPISKKAQSVAWGWIIPVVVLFVISFPPLFGHEIVGVLCGVVYGLWIGFAILSLGTLLGELGNFVVFKYFLQKRAKVVERKSLDYACMAHIVREGGFLVILLTRYSAIPGHLTTACFSAIGMNIFIFTLAAVLSLPKQLVVVYLGVAIEASGDGNETTGNKILKYAIIFLSTLVTIIVAAYLYNRMQKARPTVQARLREERYRLLVEAAPTGKTETSTLDDDGSLSLRKPQQNGFGGAAPYGHAGLDLRSTDHLAPSLDEGGQTLAGKKKRGLWSRITGKQDSEDNSAAVATQMAMQPQTSRVTLASGERASFETDSLGHAAGFTPGTSGERAVNAPHYVKRVDTRPQEYRSGAAASKDTFATTEDDVPRNWPAQQPMSRRVDGQDRLFDVGGDTLVPPTMSTRPTLNSESHSRNNAMPKAYPPTSRSRYRNVDNVGSIYELPPEASQADEKTRHEFLDTAQSRHPEGGKLGQRLESAAIWREPVAGNHHSHERQ